MQFNFDLLKNLRKKLKISQEQIANSCNCSQKTVSRWETGAGEPSLEQLQSLADLLQIDTYTLLITSGGNKNEKTHNKN